METHDTPPYSGPNTPEPNVIVSEEVDIATPTSLKSTSSRLTSKLQGPSFLIPQNLTQARVDQIPELKRHQQDLLVLTSLSNNSTLHWRPAWFKQDPFNKKFWTLHNPPNVVTEKISDTNYATKEYYTRRMRRPGDHESLYIKSWDHWIRYCDMYGVSYDFLCEEQIALMHLGLHRNAKGRIMCKCIMTSRFIRKARKLTYTFSAAELPSLSRATTSRLRTLYS